VNVVVTRVGSIGYDGSVTVVLSLRG